VGPRGINAVQLPMSNEERPGPHPPNVMATSRRRRRRPRCKARSTDVELLGGKPNDLADVVLDLDGVPEFHRGVYDIARTIPPGKTLTYARYRQAARGGVELSRDVGQALGPQILSDRGAMSPRARRRRQARGFSANGGVVTKLKMLAIEGAVVNHTPSLFDELRPLPRPLLRARAGRGRVRALSARLAPCDDGYPLTGSHRTTLRHREAIRPLPQAGRVTACAGTGVPHIAGYAASQENPVPGAGFFLMTAKENARCSTAYQ